MDGGTQAPTVSKFKYCLIPADATKEVQEFTYEGTDDEQLRTMMKEYFNSTGTLTAGQQQEFADILKARVAESHRKQQAQEAAKGGDAPEVPLAEPSPELMAGALDSSSFEIVPVVMPTLRSKFVGTSLYIDDKGRIKDLGLNDRASRVAQKDIRGDAFILSNHDDPALDEWKRVDCDLSAYQELHTSPPEASLDTGNQAAMAAATMQRENLSKLVSAEDAAKALERKGDGNQHFKAKRMPEAIQAYTDTIELVSARTDLLDNEADVLAARKAALSNRAQCYLNTGAYELAERDCRAVLQEDNVNVKAMFRLTKATIQLKDFDTAQTSLNAFRGISKQEEEAASLQAELDEARKSHDAAQRSKYKGMFA